MSNVILFMLLPVNALIGGAIQYLLNRVSEKKEYPYSQKTTALISGMIIWGICFYLFSTKTVSFGFSGYIQLYSFLVACSICLSLFFIDIKHQIIPNGHNLLLLLLGLTYLLGSSGGYASLGYGILAGFILFGLFLLIMILTRSLGGGDVKMVGGMGLFLGMSSLTNFLLISFLSGAIVSIILLVTKKKKKEDMIAFGPYLIIGFVLSLLI